MEILFVNVGVAAFTLLIYVSCVFLIAQLCNDNSIMDIAYGPAFLVTAISAITLTNTYDPLPVLISACIALWAMRLSVRIFLKNFGKPEDARYAAWRNEWLQKGRVYFLIRSYLQVNILQGLVILGVLMPFIVAWSFPDAFPSKLVVLGMFVFLFGLIYESLADWQLDHFISRKRANMTDSPIMKKGLFKYSRRPNYFGETLIWWGQAIMVIALPFGWLALLSPLLITYIVVKVTGPMLEDIFLKKYPGEYGEYIQSTPYLLPKFLKFF